VAPKPDVDQIKGLSPSIAIDQKGLSHNPRSTVGTITEVYDYLRTNQLDATTGLSESGLHDFTLMSTVNIDEIGTAGIKSKVCEYRFLILCS